MSNQDERGILPPNSIEAEQAVLGGLMLSPERIADIDWLSDRDFYRRDHQLIYSAISDIAGKGLPCDAVTLGEWFQDQGIAELVGGTRYIIELAGSTPSAANIIAYAEIVRDKSRLRTTIDVGQSIVTAALVPRAKAVDIVAEAQLGLAALEVESRVGGMVKAEVATRAWFNRLLIRYENKDKKEFSGLLTPWRSLNEITDGLQPGVVYMFPSRPSVGKSVLASNIAFFVSQHARVAYFSLEMDADQIIQRQIAAIGKVPHEHLAKVRKLDDDDWPRISSAYEHINGLDLFIDDQPGLTASQIVARTKREHLRRSLKLGIIDHAHEIKLPGRKETGELGTSLRMIRDAYRAMGIPLILLCQLNRDCTKRENKRPIMNDLRGDGGLEEVADVIIFLHREEYYDPTTYLKGVAELAVGKGRNMALGDVIYLKSELGQMRFDEWEGELPTKPKSTDGGSGGLGRPYVKRGGKGSKGK